MFRLQNAKAEEWHDRVTLIFADMRKWKPDTKVSWVDHTS